MQLYDSMRKPSLHDGAFAIESLLQPYIRVKMKQLANQISAQKYNKFFRVFRTRLVSKDCRKYSPGCRTGSVHAVTGDNDTEVLNFSTSCVEFQHIYEIIKNCLVSRSPCSGLPLRINWCRFC